MTHALIGTEPRHYERLGLAPGTIELWEDGLRTAAADGTFEWWYLDAHLDDGSTVTVEFHTKPPYLSPKAPLTPFVLMPVTATDGTRTDWTHIGEAADFRAATDDCDVAIGANTFRRFADGYRVHVEIDDITADFTLRPEVPPWRPATGHVFFGETEQHYIAWLPMVARGVVEAVVTGGGTVRRLSGTGYHDHNWGNIAPRKVLDHWYWGRARVGDYTVVTLMFVSHTDYDKALLPAMLVAKGDQIVASRVGARGIDFAESDVATHPQTGIPVGRRLSYRVGDREESFAVTFEQEHNVSTLDFGAAGAYLRFVGAVTLQHTRHGQTETVSDRTLWELLYFGERTQLPEAVPAAQEMIIGHQA